MAQLSDLISFVEDAVQDPSYDSTKILPYLNNAVEEISGLHHLPDLETEADLYVGTASYTAATIAFTATTKTIADSASGLVTAGLHPGQALTITGAGEAGNNQTTTIVSVESDGSSLVVLGTLTDEAEGESITLANDGPAFVPMPSDFQANREGNPFHLYSYGQNLWRKIYKSLRMMLREFTVIDQSGTVYGVAIRGSNLHYQRIPATPERLKVYYYRSPTAMSANADEPDGIPVHLQKRLLLSHACKEIFDLIEDGVEGEKINTRNWTEKYGRALVELSEFLGPEPRQPQEIPDELRLDQYLSGGY